jgi:hypothetical protein
MLEGREGRASLDSRAEAEACAPLNPPPRVVAVIDMTPASRERLLQLSVLLAPRGLR